MRPGVRLRRVLTSGSRGQALLLVLLFLLLGTLVLAPLLSYASTIIKYVNVSARNLSGFYAADTGVEYAMWQLRNTEVVLPQTWNLDDLGQVINGMDVEVTVAFVATYPGNKNEYTVTTTARKGTDVIKQVMAGVFRVGTVVPYTVWIETWD